VKARTHDLAAATSLAIVVVAYSPLPSLSLSTLLLAVIANQLGGIAPDIDQPTAPFWRNLPIGGFFGRIIDKMLGGHRFITHSLVGLVLLGFLFHWLLVFLQPIMHGVDIDYIWWAFIIGMISHLFMDTLTKEGVPWLLPIPIKFGIPPIKKLRITTGKNVENFIVFPILALLLLAVIAINYGMFFDLVHERIIG
jgi:inner membrane protein